VSPRDKADRFVQVQTTLDSRDRAAELVREVLDARLAACGQIVGPVESAYWWGGVVETAVEWLCLFKTRAELGERLERFLAERHPYEVPEIVVLPIERASEAYGDWIDRETRG